MELGTTLRDGKFITCPSCEELVKRMHSAQSDRLDMAKKIKDLQAHISRLERAIERASEILSRECTIVDENRYYVRGNAAHWREWLMRETD